MKNLVKFTGILAVAILAAAQAQATLLVNETFTYSDGNLAGNTPALGGTWTTFSGSGTDIQVSGGHAVVAQANAPDDAITFDGGFAAGASDKVYASFDLTLNVLPNGTGYFALFKDATTGNFGARVFVTTTNAVAGDYSIGMGNGSTPTVFASQSLTLGTTYKVVMRVDNSAGGVGTIWLNPALESDPSFTATGTSFVDPWSTFGLRETTGAGVATVENVDNLLVGTTFGDVVVPEPSTVILVGTGLLGLLALRRRHS